jgi:uncharacterized SAM-dependent methyltransferase
MMSAYAAHALKYAPFPGEDLFRTEVFAGLSARPRTLSPRWFYDQRGSELFEAITALPEYYPTRAEYNILLHHAAEIAQITGIGRALIELGSGSSVKTPLLLDALGCPAYVPIDISADFLHQSAAALAKRFPALAIHPPAGCERLGVHHAAARTRRGHGHVLRGAGHHFPGSPLSGIGVSHCINRGWWSRCPPTIPATPARWRNFMPGVSPGTPPQPWCSSR